MGNFYRAPPDCWRGTKTRPQSITHNLKLVYGAIGTEFERGRASSLAEYGSVVRLPDAALPIRSPRLAPELDFSPTPL
jgi:hypothetical protein